jgi:ABC-type sugar transport system ATPase subunit
MAHGIGYLPEDRKLLGLFAALDVKLNVGITTIDRLTQRGLLSGKRLGQLARDLAAKLHIVTPTVGAPITSLSGGNQQKVLFARWMALRPRLLVMNEPTRGVDVGAKAEIRQFIAELADQGYTFLVISTDLDELLALCDRILVLRRGRLVAEFPRGQASKQDVILAATTEQMAQELV